MNLIQRMFGSASEARRDYNPVAEENDLRASGAEARALALDEHKRRVERERDTAIASLRRTIAETEKAAAHQLEDAAATVEARRVELGREACATFYEEVRPLVKAWRAEPSRETSTAIREAFAVFASRVQHEHGIDEMQVGAHVLAIAFADEIVRERPGVADALDALALNPDPVRHWGHFVTSPGAWAEMLERLEARLEKLAASATGAPSSYGARRLEALRWAATSRDVSMAIAKLDADVRREDAERLKSTYDPAKAGWQIGGYGRPRERTIGPKQAGPFTTE